MRQFPRIFVFAERAEFCADGRRLGKPRRWTCDAFRLRNPPWRFSGRSITAPFEMRGVSPLRAEAFFWGKRIYGVSAPRGDFGEEILRAIFSSRHLRAQMGEKSFRRMEGGAAFAFFARRMDKSGGEPVPPAGFGGFKEAPAGSLRALLFPRRVWRVRAALCCRFCTASSRRRRRGATRR